METITIPTKRYKDGSRANVLFYVFSKDCDWPIDINQKLGEIKARTHREALAAAIAKNIGAGSPVWVIQFIS